MKSNCKCNYLKKLNTYLKVLFFVIAIIVVIVLFKIVETFDSERSIFYLALSLMIWLILILAIIEYLVSRILSLKEKKGHLSKKFQKPSETYYLVLTDTGRVFDIPEELAIAKEKEEEILKVKSNSPERKGHWLSNPIEDSFSYLLPITIGEINGRKEIGEEFFIEIFMKNTFDPIEIYNIYSTPEYGLEISDKCLYIEDALKALIIDKNKNNKDIMTTGLVVNEHVTEHFMKSLVIPKLASAKGYAIYRKKDFNK